jgi:hypothetical protein
MSIESDFWEFHAENPHILSELETLAADWFAAGHEKGGIGMFWEVLRWRSGLRTTGVPYMLNNNYRSYYVRLLIRLHPEWVSRFNLRELRERIEVGPTGQAIVQHTDDEQEGKA